ncbi:threonine/serine exporter family protein [Brachybacterium sp. EF45031]|uniref:threonine/serine exporter family protein n=1 Tax=Brachybacterium sillae TaxID=2810536 RepID=UPI00217D3CEB|nr:threonine/serine exporter family protein [Brachybacterium sillae]MCS6712058.1 threonine/serine exporter family protein [Brachybacterium sillae]
MASQAPWSRVPLIAALGTGAAGGNLLLAGAGLSAIGAVLIAATVLGAVAVLFARYIKLSPAGVLGVALIPLVPGMAIYQGFVALVTDDTAPQHFVKAVLIAMALGAGSVLGEYLASQVVWRGVQVERVRRQHTDSEVEDLDPRAFTAELLSAPVFRRPFIMEEFDATKQDSA